MYEEEIHFGKLLLKQSEMVLEHLTLVSLTFDPVTLKSIWHTYYPVWMCGLSLRKVGLGVLQFWTNLIVTRYQVPLNRNPSLPETLRTLSKVAGVSRIGQS